jgi:hypothetical protein
MFCNSESWDSAICRAEPCSRPLVIEAFYFLYSPFPLFNGVRGRGILGSSHSPVRSGRTGPGQSALEQLLAGMGTMGA